MQINLAYAQLHFNLAGIFRKFDLYDGSGTQTGPTLELFETNRGDIDLVSDSSEAFPKAGTRGVKVVVR
jgi:hypothetical protein